MRIGVAAGVGIGDRNTAKGPSGPCENPIVIVIGIEQRIRYIAVAVRPAIDGDRRDIALAVESTATEHAIELIADAHFEIRKSHGQELGLTDVKLRARIETGIRCAGDVLEVQNDRLRRIARMSVTAEVDRKVERGMAEETHRRGNVGDLEREPGL